MDIIRQSGREPGISRVSMLEETADAFVAEKLNIPVGTEVVRIIRVCTADGKPAIYCEDVIEKKLIKRDFMMNDLRAPIFSFLQKFCDIDAYMDLTQFHAILADEHLSKVLDIPVGMPLLNLEEVDYDIDGNIVFYSKQFFCDKILDQTVMRKKL
ncbi:MAG: UTRA domain-containing protein, partial [Anaerotignum sp.]|nr:UTRA domain-containing protein [Anaerotignum sp.]